MRRAQAPTVFSPAGGVGGIEEVARAAQRALSDERSTARLHQGGRSISLAARPRSAWTALTWKTHALVRATHPRLRDHGSLWLHGAELTRDGGVHRHLRAVTLQRAGTLLAVSPLAAELVAPDLQSQVRLVGPPVAGRRATRRRSSDDQAVRLLSVGRAEGRKGHDTAIEVARVLRADVPVTLDVVGPGPDLARLADLAADAGGGGDLVRLHGRAAGSVRDQLYADADVLLFLPRAEEGEYEGLGLVVLEAAAHGCPSVVLDCGGSRFGVQTGRSGLLLPADATPRQVADAVLELHASSTARTDAGAYARLFDLAGWDQRVRDLTSGRTCDWQWPVLPTPTPRPQERRA